MRALFNGLLALTVLAPFAALAQPEPQGSQRGIVRIGGYSGLSAEDRANYCLWSGQLYSIGASFCTRQQTLSTCTDIGTTRPPVWVSKDNDKNCDRNPSLTPQ